MRFMFLIGLALAVGVQAQPRIQPREEASATDSPEWPRLIAAADPGSQGEIWAKPEFNDRAWKTMNLPGHFENAGLPEYNGVVWFRKVVELSAEQAKEKAVLGVGQIDDMDVTWVNGKRVGGYETPGHHFTVRTYPVSAGVLNPGKNVIAVRVMDHGWGGGIAGKPEQLFLQLGSEKISLATEWRFTPGATFAQLTKTPAPKNSETIRTWTNGFALEENDVVAFIGGTTMVKQMESGYLEARLLQAAGNRPVYFRDLSWQADTVYFRQRPRNFGTQKEMLDRVQATVVVAGFGQTESMDGPGRIPEFIAAYEKVLADAQTRTERIVLITPHLFAPVQDKPHFPDLTRHNKSVKAYAQAIRGLAKEHGWVVVDLARFEPKGLTTNGLHLNPGGRDHWAYLVARQLLGETASSLPPNHADLIQAIRKKQRLWMQHWRPTNWSFLYGNRQHVPSSHDHRPGQPRWFPVEVSGIIPLIEETETEIFNLSETVNP